MAMLVAWQLNDMPSSAAVRFSSKMLVIRVPEASHEGHNDNDRRLRIVTRGK